MKRGKFIVFEGIDGCGKSTQAKKLMKHINMYLENSDIICEVSEEPFQGDAVSGLIRGALAKTVIMPEDALAYLYVADRLTHISTLLPKLEAGNHIIGDRYYFSNFAYNQTQNTSLEDLIQANKLCMKQLKPDVIFYLRISPELAEKRRTSERLSKDANDDIDKQRVVSNNYEEIMRRFSEDGSENICRIDCDNLSEDMVSDIIWDYLVNNIFPNRVFTDTCMEEADE